MFGDTRAEGKETFAVVLSDPKNAILGNSESVTGIFNDDVITPLPVSLRPQGTNVWVQFNTVEGQSYRVERLEELSQRMWVPITDPTPGTGEPITVKDSYAPLPTRFYRAVLLP